MMKIYIKEIPPWAWVSEWVIHRDDACIIRLRLDLWTWVLEADIKIGSPKGAQSISGITDTVGCNYLSLPFIHLSGRQVIIHDIAAPKAGIYQNQEEVITSYR